MSELKPCPFCGNDEIILHDISRSRLARPFTKNKLGCWCVGCVCGVENGGWFDTRKEAVVWWNHRAGEEQDGDL